MLTVAPSCELEVERGPDWLLVRVKSVDPTQPDFSLAEQLWSLLQQHFTYRLVLELDRICPLSNCVIEQLRELCQRIEKHEGVLRVCGLSPQSCRLLHASHLDEQLLPYHDRLEAITGCPHPKPR